jgi:hypothetical protein
MVLFCIKIVENFLIMCVNFGYAMRFMILVCNYLFDFLEKVGSLIFFIMIKRVNLPYSIFNVISIGLIIYDSIIIKFILHSNLNLNPDDPHFSSQH